LLAFVISYQMNEDSHVPLKTLLQIFSISKSDFDYLYVEFVKMINYRVMVSQEIYQFYQSHIDEYLKFIKDNKNNIHS